jgi:hypothetical protein
VSTLVVTADQLPGAASFGNVNQLSTTRYSYYSDGIEYITGDLILLMEGRITTYST